VQTNESTFSVSALSTVFAAMSTGKSHDQEIVMARVRERQWVYLGPILAAPVAHICVTLYRDVKTSQAKRLLLGVGVIGSTVATISMRLYLMHHAGYPGGPNTKMADRERVVSVEEKKKIENPSIKAITIEALKGFG
jgi:hypothetical protein